MALKAHKPGTALPTLMGPTIAEFETAPPSPVNTKAGAPNVLFIVLDDTGYGKFGCYGSPIRTPNLDRLANGGMRFGNMHTTALCSPSRSCILTGRNHHNSALGGITEGATGYPGSNGNVPLKNGLLSEILQSHGYNTFALGKWHLTPTDESSPAGPCDGWPLGRGFERFYGFFDGDTDQYYPDLIYDNHQVAPPKTPEAGYHLTEDLVDHAIEFIADAKQVAPEKPFFMYFCTGAMHAPHHVPKEWAGGYKGRFNEGWGVYRDKVFRRQLALGLIAPSTKPRTVDPDAVEWDSLNDDEKRLYARMMELFAGCLEYTDHQIGRLLDFLESNGQLDNTLVMVLSDNGSSAEGSPPSGWAWAGNSRFQRWKRETQRGGTSDPFVIHWPKGVAATGEIRHQYAHAIDMVPTVLEALSIEPPAEMRGVKQSPLQGISFAQSFRATRSDDRQRTPSYGGHAVSAGRPIAIRITERLGCSGDQAVAVSASHEAPFQFSGLLEPQLQRAPSARPGL